MEGEAADQANDEHVQEVEELQLVLQYGVRREERRILEAETISWAIRKEEAHSQIKGDVVE